MSLSPTKYEILETMLLYESPLRAIQVAEEIRKEFPSVIMHIIGLTRMGYTKFLEKGHFRITEEGKKALGVPKIDREDARTILAQVQQSKSFHFYASLGKPLSLRASSLQDFCDNIEKVNVDSIEFHVNRGDFEAWFAGLGDVELAKKAALLKEKKMVGEELRLRLYEIVDKRRILLASMAGHAVSSGGFS
jgi:hypothetical protein